MPFYWSQTLLRCDLQLNQTVYVITKIFVQFWRRQRSNHSGHCDLYSENLARCSSRKIFQEIASSFKSGTLVSKMCGQKICDSSLLNLRVSLIFLSFLVFFLNIFLMFFRNVLRMPDFGKSIRHPTNTPKRFKAIDSMITKMHQRWWAFKVLSQYPRESWPEMHLKITALELLRGKRAQWGIERRWKGDYLNDTSKNPMYELYRAALTKAGINQKSVVFSAEVKKFNR